MAKEIKVEGIITGAGKAGTFSPPVTSRQADKQTSKQANLITFSARGVDRDIAQRVRIYATTTEQNIGVIVTAALREYMARHGQEG